MPEKMAAPGAITELLHRWSEGDEHALDQLVPLVYPELRRMAAYQMRGERSEHTLQPTALANEAYIKLARKPDRKWENRAHFLAVAARAMRQVLIDHARIRNSKKRKVILVPLEGIEAFATSRPAAFLALDEALVALTSDDLRKARVVELRIFGGLKDQEIAELLAISTTTVERDFRFAIAWLKKAMSGKRGTDRKTKKAS
jgi:RNA polymerase sigma factor (TIGR02999 family)